MKCELVQGLAIPNTCVKFRQNRSRNKVARAMTRQDHTYIRMYIHTYIHTYVRTGKNLYPLSATARGDNKGNIDFVF
jgi:hypothetical protein